MFLRAILLRTADAVLRAPAKPGLAIAMLTGGALVAGCWPPCEDYGYDTRDELTVREDDPVHAAAIAGCFANDAACERLCLDLLPPPPEQTIRAIVECYVDRDGAGGLDVHVRSHLVKKCSEAEDWGWNWEPYPDAGGGPDATRWPDAWRDVDAELLPDAVPPDASL